MYDDDSKSLVCDELCGHDFRRECECGHQFTWREIYDRISVCECGNEVDNYCECDDCLARYGE